MMRSLLTFAGYNLLFGAAIPGIDNSAHIGGLLMGLALGAILGPHRTEVPERRQAHERIVFIAAAFLLVGMELSSNDRTDTLPCLGGVRRLRTQLKSIVRSLNSRVPSHANRTTRRL